MSETLHPNIALLNREPRDLKFANTRPSDAATLIVLDRAGSAPRVLMGKRSQKLKFMPGMFVFPGGRAEADDIKVPVATRLMPEVETQLTQAVVRPSLARAHRLALAAIRETFEETGLVIGIPGEAGLIAEASRRLGANATPSRQPGLPSRGNPPPGAASGGENISVWTDYMATGFLPDLASLRFLARAITPPRRPRRFDTRFFVVEAQAIRHSVGDVVGPEAELTELAWLTLEETHDLPLPAITRAILNDMEAALAEGSLGRSGAIPFYSQRHRRFVRNLI